MPRRGQGRRRRVAPRTAPLLERDRAPVVVLHIGTMKSGTTYLQSRLEHNKAELAADGVLFPGERWTQQMRAAGDAMRAAADPAPLPTDSPWRTMVTSMLDWPGERVVFSVEHLSKAGPDAAAYVVGSLAPAQVEVVITARDLGRAIPSMWQQALKGGIATGFEAYVEALADETGNSDARQFWRRQDAAEQARRWAGVVGAEHVHVVAVPAPGSPPDLLWQRFAETAGLDADRYAPPGSDLVLNPSLGAAGAEVLRRLNAVLGDQLTTTQYRRLVKHPLANGLLAGWAGDVSPTVPAASRPWMLARARRLADELVASGVRIVGELDDLIPSDRSDATTAVDGPAQQELALELAVSTAAALIREVEGRRGPAGGRKGRYGSILEAQLAAAERRETTADTTTDPPPIPD